MKQIVNTFFTLIAGIAVGAAGIGALGAQSTKKPAYVIAEVEVTDQPALQTYAAKVPDTLKPYNAKMIVRGKADAKEGDGPKGIVVMLVFDSMDDAQKWYATAPYAPLIAERQKAAETRLYIVEGMPQ